MCLKRLNYDRKELERRREASQHEIKGNTSSFSNKCLSYGKYYTSNLKPKIMYIIQPLSDCITLFVPSVIAVSSLIITRKRKLPNYRFNHFEDTLMSS